MRPPPPNADAPVTHAGPPQRPPPPPPPSQANPAYVQANNMANNGSLFGSLKGGAGSFLKNLKEQSSRVMQTVQQ